MKLLFGFIFIIASLGGASADYDPQIILLGEHPGHDYPKSNYVSNKKEIKTFDVFEKPNGDKKGVIFVFYTHKGFELEYQGVRDRVISSFSSNLKKSGNLYQALDVDGPFAKLGEGPWGPSAWIETPVFSFFDDQVYYFKGAKEDEYIEYLRKLNGDIYKRIFSNKILYSDNLFEGRIEQAQHNELFDENQIIKLELIYKKEIKRNSRELPLLVDLTNQKLNILTSNHQTEVTVYDKPEHNGNILGSIKYSLTGEKLLGEYLPFLVDNKKSTFNADFYSGRCGDSFYFSALHNVRDIHNEFSDIGSGPWGDHGWVNSRRFNMALDPLPVTLAWDFNEWDYKKENKVPKAKCDQKTELDLQRLVEPHYLSLIPEVFEKTPNDMNCTAEVGATSTSICVLSEENCRFYFTNTEKAKKSFQSIRFNKKPSKVIAAFAGKPIDSKYYLVGPTVEFEEIMKPSSPNIYAIDYPKDKNIQISSFKPSIAANSSDVELSYPEEHQILTFKLFNKKESTKSQISLELYGEEITKFNSNELKIGVSEGLYQFVFIHKTDKGLRTYLDKQVSISSINSGNVEISINISDFKQRPNSTIFSWRYDSNGSLYLNDVGIDKRVHTIDKLTVLSDEDVDGTNLVEIHRGHARLKDELKNKLDKGEVVGFLVEGSCRVAEIPELEHVIPLYEKPNLGSKNIGKIISRYKPNGYEDIKISFVGLDNIEQSFTPNLYSGHCEPMDNKNLHIQQAWSGYDNWGNIGDGPWGKEAWVNSQPKSLFDGNFSFKLNDEFYDARFYRYENNLIRMEFQSGDRRETKIIELQDILSPNGKIKIPLICEMF